MKLRGLKISSDWLVAPNKQLLPGILCDPSADRRHCHGRGSGGGELGAWNRCSAGLTWCRRRQQERLRQQRRRRRRRRLLRRRKRRAGRRGRRLVLLQQHILLISRLLLGFGPREWSGHRDLQNGCFFFSICCPFHCPSVRFPISLDEASYLPLWGLLWIYCRLRGGCGVLLHECLLLAVPLQQFLRQQRGGPRRQVRTVLPERLLFGQGLLQSGLRLWRQQSGHDELLSVRFSVMQQALFIP